MIILLSGFVFSWETALHAMLVVFLSGMASDFVLEGPSTVRSVTIVTNEPDALTSALMQGLNRGVSSWHITGGYTGETRAMLMCTVFRPQVNELKRIVAMTDPNAFVVVGTAHQAMGGGFGRLKSE